MAENLHIKTEALRSEAKKIMDSGCRTKGSQIIAFAEYIRARYGQGDLLKVEAVINELGYSFAFSQLRLGEWYKEGFHVLSLFVAKHLFGWSEKDIYDVGYTANKISASTKIYIKFFSSKEKTFKYTPVYWRKFVDCGIIDAHEFNDKERHCTLWLKDYASHPIMCHYLAGYFASVTENAVSGGEVKIQETKCIFKGDSYHEFILKW